MLLSWVVGLGLQTVHQGISEHLKVFHLATLETACANEEEKVLNSKQDGAGLVLNVIFSLTSRDGAN